jgi:hypothetical protein
MCLYRHETIQYIIRELQCIPLYWILLVYTLFLYIWSNLKKEKEKEVEGVYL